MLSHSYWENLANMYEEGMSHREMAKYLGKSENTIKQHIHRARKMGYIRPWAEVHQERICPCCGSPRSRWKKEPR